MGNPESYACHAVLGYAVLYSSTLRLFGEQGLPMCVAHRLRHSGDVRACQQVLRTKHPLTMSVFNNPDDEQSSRRAYA